MISVARIEALRQEAREAGDVVQVVICGIALADHDGSTIDDYSGGGHSHREMARIAQVLLLTQAEAWSECARVIAAAEVCK